MEILNSIWASVLSILSESGLLGLFEGEGWKNAIMIGIACFLLYLAIGRKFEPLLLLPIAFGMLLVNIYPDIMAEGGLLHYFFKLDECTTVRNLDDLSFDLCSDRIFFAD